MLVFVDFEHASAHARKHGERILAARTRLTYRLEDLAGLHCHLVRYDRIDQHLLDTLGATAIFVSGNSVSPHDYDAAQLESVEEIIRTTDLPVFGFCGGFQLIAQALGVDVVALPVDGPRRADPTVVVSDEGRAFEYGYHPIDVVDGHEDHPLVADLGDCVFRHAHGFHVPELPIGFSRLASTAATPNQIAVDDRRRIVGTQFHPEYWTDEHPAGRSLIANFMRWAGVAEVE